MLVIARRFFIETYDNRKIFCLDTPMAHCSNLQIVLNSIEEIWVKRKRRDHETVVSHAKKKDGLIVND